MASRSPCILISRARSNDTSFTCVPAAATAAAKDALSRDSDDDGFLFNKSSAVDTPYVRANDARCALALFSLWLSVFGFVTELPSSTSSVASPPVSSRNSIGKRQRASRRGCAHRVGADPRAMTKEEKNERAFSPSFSFFRVCVASAGQKKRGFVSTSHICSVSTKLATFPSVSAPRQWWRTPWRARATRATTETTANASDAAFFFFLVFVFGRDGDARRAPRAAH
mmetsp:Transcript_8594/g.35976  ORF Transcript_8594/g.35976 Transcript_8594/m.35976 type:complete len:226 (-) Transcript_8594:784-1461(-)